MVSIGDSVVEVSHLVKGETTGGKEGGEGGREEGGRGGRLEEGRQQGGERGRGRGNIHFDQKRGLQAHLTSQ